MSERTISQSNYNNARANLLVMALLTVLNTVLILLDVGLMFPFSAFFPQIVVTYSQWYGMPELFIAGVIIAFLCIGFYLLCYFLSKKHVGWMTTALVFFTIDTAFVLFEMISYYDFSMLIDLVFHAWVLFYLFRGVSSGSKLKKLPPESEIIPQNVSIPQEVLSTPENSTAE